MRKQCHYITTIKLSFYCHFFIDLTTNKNKHFKYLKISSLLDNNNEEIIIFFIN